jgi:hypothetical protein
VRILPAGPSARRVRESSARLQCERANRRG